MQTDYWISAGRIFGPGGFTGFYIDNGHKIIGRRGYTRHWIYQRTIYSKAEGNTGFRIEENRIHGPLPEPPWERPTH
jgi:hypothetical protein